MRRDPRILQLADAPHYQRSHPMEIIPGVHAIDFGMVYAYLYQ